MKILFKSFFNQEPQAQAKIEEQYQKFTDVMDVVSRAYPKVVQEIHMEFMTAGDRLLASAKSIIEKTVIENESKVNNLKSFGFSATTEVKKATEAIAIKSQQNNLAEAITRLSQEFPLYKVITEDAVKTICDKYNLILGSNSRYKGFVPEKNLKDIEQFFNNHPDEKTAYYYQINNINYITNTYEAQVQYISKDEYERALEFNEEIMRHGNIMGGRHYPTKSSALLEICAPLKDMNTDGHKVVGHKLVREIPDPVVLLPKMVDGIKMYVILTAWGDEASDPLVANQNNN